MKRALIAFILILFPATAPADPNADGIIIPHDANLLMSGTNGSVSLCEQGLVPGSCGEFDVRVNGANDPARESIVRMYMVFPAEGSPRVIGLTWGIHYDAGAIQILHWGACGDLELNDPTWPASDTGSTVTWDTVQTGHIVPFYWFGAYADSPATLDLRDNPTQGGFFGDDSMWGLDDIDGYGKLGFDMDGEPACADWVYAACCKPDGTCSLLTQEVCYNHQGTWHPGWPSCDPDPCATPGVCCAPDGSCTLVIGVECDPPAVWHPEWVSCDPDPCPGATPVERSSWGRIKSAYR